HLCIRALKGTSRKLGDSRAAGTEKPDTWSARFHGAELVIRFSASPIFLRRSPPVNQKCKPDRSSSNPAECESVVQFGTACARTTLMKGGLPMSPNLPEQDLSEKDRLVTRPPGPLPTKEDPKKPRGEPFDPKPTPEQGQTSDPSYTETDYTA